MQYIDCKLHIELNALGNCVQKGNFIQKVANWRVNKIYYTHYLMTAINNFGSWICQTSSTWRTIDFLDVVVKATNVDIGLIPPTEQFQT